MRTVLLFFDTLRRDALSPYAEQTRASRQAAHEAAIAAGYRPPPHLVEPHTPNFQRLADRCRTHDLHYAGSMPCMPARRELHTGRYNFLHSSWGPLEPFDVSMPRLLHDAGVHSHLISDHYHYWEGGGATYHTRYSTWDNVRGQEGDPWIARPGAQVAAPALGCPHRFMTDQDSINRRWMLANGYHPQRETFTRGLQFLDANHEADDWFLQIETFDPHEPFFADETSDDPTVREYDGPRFDWPAYGPVSETPEQVAHAQGRYRNLVAMCDRQLGRVLDTFDRLGLWDTTALIVTTDHGFLLGEHREWGKIVQPLFEEVIHIPLFMHVPAGHPGATEPGSRSTRLTQTVDISPTILDLHGVPRPDTDHYDGASLCRSDNERNWALFGIFACHVCVTDGRQVYMRAPDTEQPVYEHRLMPWTMREPAPQEDLDRVELWSNPGFARNRSVMRYPGRLPNLKIPAHLRDLAFDLVHDPAQLDPMQPDMMLQDELVSAMKRAEAPGTLFSRLGVL